MHREPPGGSDDGQDMSDLGDEPPARTRDHAPDYLGSIDAAAPVSGHVPPAQLRGLAADQPEHDWSAAAGLLYPTFRPVGTKGIRVEQLAELGPSVMEGARSNTQPLLDEGPCGLPIFYFLSAGSFDIIVNGEHLLSWGVRPSEIQDAAMRNLAAWSATTPWTDEVSGTRRILSSDSGDGWDAARILLPEAREHLAAELGAGARILVGLPERHLLIAGALHPGDEEFADLFADFVIEQSGGADDPIDRRVFELVDRRLVEFTLVAAG
jgi:hypothetical protein